MPSPTPSPGPRLIRGSVITHRRRCGKPTCRCADGESLHESDVLSYSENGRTRLLMLPSPRVAAVRRAVARYRLLQAKLEGQANAGLAELVAELSSGRGMRA